MYIEFQIYFTNTLTFVQFIILIYLKNIFFNKYYNIVSQYNGKQWFHYFYLPDFLSFLISLSDHHNL